MTKLILSMALVLVGGAAATLAFLHFPRVRVAAQRAVSPGQLSQPHAFLENNCAACHTAVKGVVASKCIACHANDTAILQRQPTVFHANITSCAECHLEHLGRVERPIGMDHEALARIGLRQLLSEATPGSEAQHTAKSLATWLREENAKPSEIAWHPKLASSEKLLNCAACHQTEDPHIGFFGLDCAQCHSTARWTVAEFRHPSPSSMSCAQCHQAPPSHYMMHFKMIDQSVCGQPNAKVNQCYLCHQTTAWNDIKGIGYYKHH